MTQSPLTALSLPFDEISVRKREIYQFLGYGTQTPDHDTVELCEKSLDSVGKISRLAVSYVVTSVNVTGNECSFLGISVKSRDLAKCISGCGALIIFAATCGAEVDRYLSRLAVMDKKAYVIADACAGAVIEGFCDKLCSMWEEKYGKLTPRFSPGYGDLDISCQRQFTSLLDTKRKIGLSLTDGMMLTPTKSVTAVTGFRSEK